MATDVLANLIPSLGKTFDKTLWEQWNREAKAVKHFGVRPGDGPTLDWVVQFGAATATVVGEGSVVTDGQLTNDLEMPATLSYGIYRSGFSVTDKAVDAAKASASAPDALRSLIAERISGSMSALISKLNYDFWNGTGTENGQPAIVGLLGGALDNTGTYAGIDRAVFPEWQATVLANGGVDRPLTTDLLAQAESESFEAGEGFNDEDDVEIWTTAAILRKYEDSFINGNSNILINPSDKGGYGIGAAKLYWRNIPMYRDKDIPAGTVVFVRRNGVKLVALPPDGDIRRMTMQPVGEMQSPIAGLVPRMYSLGRVGNLSKVVLEATVQLELRRPNSFVVIKDIDESV